MALDFLKHTPKMILEKITKDLALIDPALDMKRFYRMTPRLLEQEIRKLKTNLNETRSNSLYGSWLRDGGFVKNNLLSEALTIIRDHKLNKLRAEKIIEGYTYFYGVKQFGDKLIGKKYMGESDGSTTTWRELAFETSIVMEKAFEVLKCGREADFRRIYMELSDGRADGLVNVRVEHITESSDAAKKAIAKYCDSVWEGPWPWEVSAPLRLITHLEEKREMKKTSLQEMQFKLEKLLHQLQEDEMQKYELLQVTGDMMKTVDSMISDLGKISSSGIEAVAAARASVDGGTAGAIEQALGEPMNHAADALSALKAALHKALQRIENGGATPDMGGDMDLGLDQGDEMPGDLGGNGDLSDDLSDVNVDGTDEERPMKRM